MQGKIDYTFVSRIALKCGVCTLLLLHSIYSFINLLSDYFRFILHNLKQLCYRTYISKSVTVSVLEEELKCFPKIPKHLAVIIDEEDISYHDCIKLILWCIHSGISFISFYSHSSAINPTTLYEVLCKRSKNSLQSIKWGKSFHESVKEMAKKDINGYIWTPVVEVNLFSSKSVFDNMENMMLMFCREKIDPNQITIDTVDQKFKEDIPLPDPCLAIICGKTFSTFGFLPWQIRVTEILRVPTHHQLQVEDFLSALKHYAYCQQRFGK